MGPQGLADAGKLVCGERAVAKIRREGGRRRGGDMKAG
jgi:hypothetical protein